MCCFKCNVGYIWYLFRSYMCFRHRLQANLWIQWLYCVSNQVPHDDIKKLKHIGWTSKWIVKLDSMNIPELYLRVSPLFVGKWNAVGRNSVCKGLEMFNFLVLIYHAKLYHIPEKSNVYSHCPAKISFSYSRRLISNSIMSYWVSVMFLSWWMWMLY